MSSHWYLGVLQRQQSDEYQLQTHNNCISLINEQAENKLRAVGKVLSRLARHRVKLIRQLNINTGDFPIF